MERSLQELGAGRSILIDKNGNIIAGNKTQEAAKKAGIKKVRIIETTGDELVAVKRTDVDIDSEQGRELAMLDNLTQQVNLKWDERELHNIKAEVEGFNPEEWGMALKELEDKDFEDNFDSHNNSNAVYPLIPKYDGGWYVRIGHCMFQAERFNLIIKAAKELGSLTLYTIAKDKCGVIQSEKGIFVSMPWKDTDSPDILEM